MSQPDNKELESQIAELRAVLDGMAQGIVETDDTRTVDDAELRAQVASIQETLDEVRSVLLGNSTTGVVDLVTGLTETVDKLMSTVEGLGRIFESEHLKGQEQSKLIASLVEQIDIAKVWKYVAEILETILVSQRAPRRGAA